MKVRQIYVEDEKRIAAFAGSIGYDESLPLRMTIAFNIDGNDKNILFDLIYNESTQRYENPADTNEYAYISNNILTLNCNSNGIYQGFDFNIENDEVIVDEPIIITIKGTNYTTSGNGLLALYYRSMFIDDEGNLSTFDNRCTYATSAEAVRQFLMQHHAIIKNELWYNYKYGLPLMQKGLTKAMIDAEAINVINECPLVDYIISFDSKIEGKYDYKLSYSVMTKYGKIDLIDTL